MFNAGGSGIGLDIGSLLGNVLSRGGNNGDGGFGNGNGAWWVLIILFALFSNGGWGNRDNNSGNNGGGGSGTMYYPLLNSDFGFAGGALQRGFDNQSVINKLNGLENGICSLGYDQLAQMNGLNTNIMQTGFGITNAIQQAQNAAAMQFNQLSSQQQSCCCNIENLIAQAKYDRAADTCAITTAISQAAQNIIQNDNCNYRQLHDEMVEARIAEKDELIANLRTQLSTCNLKSSQDDQTNYLLSQLLPQNNCGFRYGCNTGCCNS